MTYISILIPLYNGIEFLEQSLSSVISQTYKNWEVIIGINGHEPNSLIEKTAIAIVDKYNYDNIKVIYYDTKGKSLTLNKMVTDCKYDYVAILDVDDIWLPEKLELQIRYLSNYDVAGTHCQYFGDVSHCPIIPFGDLSNFNFLFYNPIVNSSAIIKKELAIWKNVEIEDYNLWLELFINGKKKFFNLNKILCLHRIHKGSYFNTRADNDKYVMELKAKFIK